MILNEKLILAFTSFFNFTTLGTRYPRLTILPGSTKQEYYCIAHYSKISALQLLVSVQNPDICPDTVPRQEDDACTIGNMKEIDEEEVGEGQASAITASL